MRYGGIWRDRELVKEIAAALEKAGLSPAPLLQQDGYESTDEWQPGQGSAEEAIILGVGRPAFYIQDDSYVLDAGEVWSKRLARARSGLLKVLRAVGRIERGAAGEVGASMIGTGWLLAPDVIVTNRHVALVFSKSTPDGWTFTSGEATPRIDMRAEHEREAGPSCPLASVIHVEDPDGPDVAFLKLSQALDVLPDKGMPLEERQVQTQDVATIGYPAWDGQRNPGPEMKQIFGEAFGVKRLAPGFLLGSEPAQLEHDCSTLGGNSGSLVWGLRSGKALGLHYAGCFKEANYAVPAPVVAEIAKRMKVRE